jgi:hypothetical protein
MTSTQIPVPYCGRACIQCLGHIVPNDYFYFVSFGLIEIHHQTKMMYIYEKEEWMADGIDALPKLSIDLVKDVDSITLRQFRSAGGNFAGGLMVLEGKFDRPVRESLMFKTGVREYKQICDVIESLDI